MTPARWLSTSELAQWRAIPVAVVSKQAARLLGIENGAIGRRIRLAESQGDWRTVVGVAAETRYRAIRQDAPTVYLPVAQFPEVMTLITTLVVRTEGRPAGAIPSIRNAIGQADSDVSVLQTVALSDLVSGEFPPLLADHQLEGEME